MKRLKRNLYIMKCRIHVMMNHMIERVLHTLSNLGFIVEHNKDYTHVIDQGNPQTDPDFTSQRFVFIVSHVTYKIEFTSEYWFETKRGKRIFTVYENHHVENRISYRAELKSFYAHFSHKHRLWVHSHSPRVVLSSENYTSYYTCDFSKCRYALELRLPVDQVPSTSEEVIFESYKVLGNSLTSKVLEINETLTGAKNDGELTSPSGLPLADNILCKECGCPVFATNIGNYTYLCINHGIIEFEKCAKVDPKTYEVNLTHCMSELEKFCDCPQD